MSLSTAPPRSEGEIRRVRALLELGRVGAALGAARRLVASEPEDPERLELLGLCLLRGGEIDAALTALGDARRGAPEQPHVHYLIGFCRRQKEDGAGAEAAFREALRLDPGEPVYLRALAELLVEHSHAEEALVLARRAVEGGPDRAANHLTLGFVASASGRVDLALREYRVAVGLDPTDAAAWNNLGCVELAQGDKLGARESFRRALELEPGAARTQRNLQLVLPAARPAGIYQDFEAFLGEVLRELMDAGRLGSPLRALALARTLGKGAVGHAMTARLGGGSPAGRIGVAAGAAVATAALRMMGAGSLLPVGALAAVAGAGWLATARKVTPMRRRFAAHVARARARYDELRLGWLEGRVPRASREAAIDRLLEKLAIAIDREPSEEEATGGDTIDAGGGGDAMRDGAKGRSGADEGRNVR